MTVLGAYNPFNAYSNMPLMGRVSQSLPRLDHRSQPLVELTQRNESMTPDNCFGSNVQVFSVIS
jgi:hypothetical protein